MPRLARTRPLTLPGLVLKILLFPFVVMGVFMVGVLAFGTLSLVATLLVRIFN